MDYVVFGIGFGATILVLGLLVRDVGPRLRYRNPAGDDGVFHAEELVARVSWGRFCSALGAVLAIGGLLFLITTIVCMVLRLSDETGGWVMIGALAFLLLLMAYWTWAFFDRFGSYGILPEREEKPEPVPAPVSNQARLAEAARNGDRRTERPAASTSGESSDEAVESEPEEPAPAQVAPGSESEEPEEPTTPESDEPEAADVASDTESEATEGPSLQTPEERLAHMETPINHGSAEGDLDIAAGGPKRPAPRPRRVVPRSQQEPRSAADPARSNEQDEPISGDDDASSEHDRDNT